MQNNISLTIEAQLHPAFELGVYPIIVSTCRANLTFCAHGLPFALLRCSRLGTQSDAAARVVPDMR